MKNFTWFLAAMFCLCACAHDNMGGLPRGALYVNMGSSFAAGAGTGAIASDSPPRCFQSSVNYARQLAERLHLSLKDVSCAGATTANVLSTWRELPAQLDAIASDTRLVTIIVGGNDIAFVGNLTAASCELGETMRVAGMVLPCPAPFPVTEEAYATLERNFRDIARQITARAPHARIVFIQYLSLVPERQCPQSRFSEAEAAQLRLVARRLAEITSRAATQTNAEVLRMDEISRRHTPCDPDPWSTGLPRNYDEAMGAPWHPNRRGMEVIAGQLAQMLAR